jgi:DNA-binding SARP family transcriptional activator
MRMSQKRGNVPSAPGLGSWGSAMPTYGSESDAVDRPRVDDNTSAHARRALTETLTELRRLTQDPLFDGVERIVADLGNAPTGSIFGVDTVRKLRHWSAEHQRVAIELEAAARCCRLVEREINQLVDALLAGREGKLSTTFGPNVEASSANTRRRIGLSEGLREIFHRGRADSRRSEERPVPVTCEDGPLPGTPSAAPVVRYPGPRAPVPEADIAALMLGPLEVHVAGRRVPRWNSLKARAVFQYLLIHQDRPIRRDALMALQWPEHSHNSARNNLNVALYSLRNTLDGLGLGTQPILYRDGCYILNPGLTWWIDRNEFLSALDDARQARRANRLEQSIDAYHKAIWLYRGPLFDDDVAGEWYLPEQRQLKELYVQALVHVAEIHFQLGEFPDAERFGQLAVSNDPCCEPIHRMLMRYYASQHQQQLVSRQYRVCVTALHDELGVPPAEETVHLFRTLTSAPQARFLCA